MLNEMLVVVHCNWTKMILCLPI